MRWLVTTVLLFQAAILTQCAEDVNLGEIIAYMKEIAQSCRHDVESRVEREREAWMHQGEHEEEPFDWAAKLMTAEGPSIRMSYVARNNLEILRRVVERFDLTKDQILELLPYLPAVARFPEHSTVTANEANWYHGVDCCPYARENDLVCDSDTRYRTIDGSCNNLDHTLWGSSYRPLRRLMNPDYGDGFNSPRLNSESNPLPNERLISAKIFQVPVPEPDPVVTLASMVFGQFVAHDIGKTVLTQLPGRDDKAGNVGCGEDGCSTEGPGNEACFPIMIPTNDTWDGVINCLKFVRSLGVTQEDCTLDQRQQMSQVTSYLDLSMIYGSTDEEFAKLRDTDTSRGRMRSTPNPKPGIKPLLSQVPDTHNCRGMGPGLQCYGAGDSRSNENIGLTVWYTVLMRYHNFIEQQLFDLNPSWDGEKLFQEARHICIAVWQNLVYNEYLPITLGPGAMTEYGLWLKEEGSWDPYNSETNSETFNVFQAGAFRFGHSQVPNNIRLVDKTFAHAKTMSLAAAFHNPDEFYTNDNPAESATDGLFFGQLIDKSEKMDCAFAEIITNHLFATPTTPGLDLPSFNVHRGRDHGLPSYYRWRAYCGLSEDLSDIPAEKHAVLAELYASMEDVDFYVGGALELPVSAGVTGPLFTCIVARQFHNYKFGDRFWFERQGITGFTEEQRKSIRSMTMARILCDTMDDVDVIQPYVQLQPLDKLWNFLFSSGRWSEVYHYLYQYRRDLNYRRPCSDIPTLDVSLFV